MFISEPFPAPAGGQLTHIHHLVEEIPEPQRRKSRVVEFLDSLDAGEQADIMARLQKLDGAPFFRTNVWQPMGEWFKNIGDCWEVGDDGRVRIYAFRDRNRLVLAVACKKRGKKTPKETVAECVRLEGEFKRQAQERA